MNLRITLHMLYPVVERSKLQDEAFGADQYSMFTAEKGWPHLDKR